MFETIIPAIGTSQFAKVLFAELQPVLSLRQLVIYRFLPDASIELLMAESADDDQNMHRVIRDYSRSLHKRDPIRDRTCPMPVRQLAVRHLEAEAIPDAVFRDTLYRTQRMASKTAIVVQRPSDVMVIGFFRGEEAGELSSHQWEFVQRSAGAIAASVERHVDLLTTPMTIDWESRLQAISDRTALSRREIAVCTQILEGYFNEAIALNMGLSVHSVITYRRRAFAKLGISTLSELFAMVLRSKPNFSPPAVLRDTAFQITGCEEVADGRGHWDGSWAGQIAYTALTEASPRPSADGGGGRRAASRDAV